MADFIKVSIIMDTVLHDGRSLELPMWLSKYHITDMDDDNKGNCINMIYNGKEIQIRGSIDDLLKKFL